MINQQMDLLIIRIKGGRVLAAGFLIDRIGSLATCWHDIKDSTNLYNKDAKTEPK